MARVGCEAVIQHFSHPQHPLELSNLLQQQALAPATCAGCRLRASGWVYSCNACSGYHLHVTCAQMPRLINHPADPHHPLALHPVPAYAEGVFTCDACGRAGSGFSYHCATCGLDLHPLCASVPLSVNHHAHPHALALAFSPPYATNGFSCDVCGGVGASHWLYRCAACEFDAHLGCATAPATRPPQQPQAGAAPAVGSQRGFQPAVGVPPRAWPGSGLGVAPPMVSRSGSSNRPGNNSFVGQAIQGFVEGAAQQMGQSLVQSILGGGAAAGGGGNAGAVQGGSYNPLLVAGSSVIGAVLGGGGGSST